MLSSFYSKICWGWFLLQASEDLLREHYIDLKDRPFYEGLVQYMHSGPVVAMVGSQLRVHCFGCRNMLSLTELQLTFKRP